MHASSVPSWGLSDLTVDEAETLARQVLGPGFGSWVARRLAVLSTDCPLVTVVGAGLIRRGRVDPSQLEGNDLIRSEILQAFRDALVAEAAPADQSLRGAVLDALALFQPFRLDDEAFQASLSSMIGAPFDRAIAHIRSLESAGVLLRRGNSVRVVPDLLGDVVVASVALDDQSGSSTGYVERARSAAQGEVLYRVFVNASRVDWQVRREQRSTSSIANVLWDAIQSDFEASGIRGRTRILGSVKRVAFFMPERALALVEWALANWTDEVEGSDDLFAGWHVPTYREVLNELPAILKLVAFNLEFLPPAVRILWALAQTDDRPPPQNPNHTLRSLQELASWEVAKPIAYNEAMVTEAADWLGNEFVGPHSPFDVLEQLLATEGHDDSFDGRRLTMRPFAISRENTAHVRERVLALALREVENPDRGALPEQRVRWKQRFDTRAVRGVEPFPSQKLNHGLRNS